MKYTLLKTQRTSGWHLKYGNLKLPLYPQRYEDVQGSGCEAVGITDFGNRWRWIAWLHLSVGSLHLPVGLQVGWVPWANLTSFSSLISNSGRWVVIRTTAVLTAVPAYWQLCLLTDNGGRTSCTCLLTMVAERAVPAYWQWWQKELCLLTDNDGRISSSVVSTSDSNDGQSECEARPGGYSSSVQAISWIYSVSFGNTWDSTLLRGPVQFTEILSGHYKKIGIFILKRSTSIWFQGRHTDFFQTLHHTVM